MSSHNPDHFKQGRSLVDIFEHATDLSSEARNAYLEEACDGNASLRAEVESLLAAHDQQDHFLDHSVALGPTIETAASVLPATPIGRYTIRAVIGEGSFGVVYLAEQYEPVRRTVALKLLRPGLHSRGVLVRFAAETQALALLEHPGIARLYDAGETPEKQPYFVMEHVDGKPIDQYCDQRKFTIRERLTVFADVCDAVYHGHQKGLIHRDLKPSNILVTKQNGVAQPKIIDFGVAKAITSDPKSGAGTEIGQIIGTPEYMSPEQADNPADIDVRSDVYSLAVVLYQLVCGLLPFDGDVLRAGGSSNMIRMIREVAPPSLNARLEGVDTEKRAAIATACGLARIDLITAPLRELQQIVTKAMCKERGERYDSVAELGRDVRRYLNGEPLVAGPGTTMYRFRKYARRHRGALAAAALVLLGVVIGTGIALVRETRLRHVAETNTTRAQQFKAFMQQMIAGYDPAIAMGRDRTLLKELLAQGSMNAEQAFADDPIALSDMLDAIGNAFWRAGENDLAEINLFRAFELRRVRLGVNDPATWQSAHVLAFLYNEIGGTKKAEQLARQAVTEQTRLLGPLNNDTLSSIELLGLILAGQTETEKDGLQLLEESLATGRKAWGSNSIKTATLENNVAGIYKRADRLDLALPLYEHALTVMKSGLGEDDPGTLSIKGNLAGAYKLGGDTVHALALFQELVPRCRRVLGDKHPQTLVAMNNLGAAYEKLDHLDEAEQWYNTALDVQQKVLVRDHPDTIATINNLAIVQFKRGTNSSLDAAEKLLQEVLGLETTRFGDESAQKLKSLNTLAMVYDKTAKPEAGPIYERLLTTAKKVNGEAHVDTLVYISNYADWCERNGDVEKARELYENAATVSAKERGESDFAALWASSDLAVFLRNRQQFENALSIHERIVSLARKNNLPAENIGIYLTAYGKTLLAAHQYTKAEVVLVEAEKTLADVLGAESPQLASTRAALDEARKNASEVKAN